MDLRQRLQQQQTISQRLQQSLALLALPITDLETAVEAELETNPALERDAGSAPDDASPPEESSDDAVELGSLGWEAYFDAARGTDDGEAEDEPRRDYVTTLAGPAEGLKEHLRRQLEVSAVAGHDGDLALEIISALDDDGYLRTPAATLAEEMETTAADVERVLTDVVQRLEPSGVGARDLSECLLLQWEAAGDEAPALAGRIIRDHLPAAVGPASRLAATLGEPEEDVETALAFIRSLEPRPGRMFGGEPNAVLTPDVRVELVGDAVRVTVLEDPVGRLFISPAYRELLTHGEALDDKTRRYLKARVNAASWFIRALHQRRRTIENVTRAVFERQRDFLVLDEPGLKPLTMEEVATSLDLHVSTISRTVAGKIVETPRGFFPLKKFFGGFLASDAGDIASDTVKVMLEDILAGEDADHPYSDDELARILNERGIRVARRTVAKYRTQLKIPPKHERKKGI